MQFSKKLSNINLVLFSVIFFLLLLIFFRPKDNLHVVANNQLELKAPREYTRSPRTTANKAHLPDSNRKEDLFIQMIKSNPRAAIDFANSQDLKITYLSLIGKEWVLVDPNACIDWALHLEPRPDRRSVIIEAMSSLVGAGRIDETLDMINKFSEGDMKDAAISYTFATIARYDIEKGRSLINKISGESTTNLVAGSLAQIYADNRQYDRMKDLWGSLPDGNFREVYGSAIGQVLAKEDPSSAFNWILHNLSHSNLEASLGDVAYAFSKNNPEVGLKLSDEINDINQRSKFIEKLGLSWGFSDPAKASNWLLEQVRNTNYSQNQVVGDGIIYKWVQTDPDGAFSKIETIANEVSRNQAILVATRSLSEINPAKAATLLMPFLELNSDDVRGTIGEVAENWLLKDPLVASEWIGGLKNGPLKDAAIVKLVSNVLSKDRDVMLANSWAMQISDLTIKEKIYAKIDKTNP